MKRGVKRVQAWGGAARGSPPLPSLPPASLSPASLCLLPPCLLPPCLLPSPCLLPPSASSLALAPGPTRTRAPTPQVSLRENLSPVCHFGEDTPPLFIWHTANDATVPVAHALEAFRSAREADVPNVELHLYGGEGQAGRHAQGLASNNPALCGWSDQLLAWLGEDFREPR